jgi:hypothetical protein
MAKVKRAKKPEDRKVSLSPKALEWLSRGLLEQIENSIARALDNTWAVDICIYEYELDAICNAVNAAYSRNVKKRSASRVSKCGSIGSHPGETGH